MQDKNQKGNKFLYQGAKQKVNSWGSVDEQSGYSQQPSGTSINAGHNSLSTLNFKGSGFDFDNAWSIRKNVPLISSNSQPAAAKNTTGTSYYSRHVNTIKGGAESSSSNDFSKGSRINAFDGNNNSNVRGWNFRKPEYSYGANSTTKRQMSGNEDERSGSAAKRPNKLSSDSFVSSSRNQAHFQTGHGLAESVPFGGRKNSARTEKAKKLYNSYLKSAGLGQYSTDNMGTYNDEGSSFSSHRQRSAGSDRSF